MSTTVKNSEKELELEKAKQTAADQKSATEKLEAGRQAGSRLDTKTNHELTRAEIEALVEKAHLLNNPSLRQALYIETYRREHSRKELNATAAKIRALIRELSQETDPEKLYKLLFEKVLKQNKLDAQLIKALNAFLKDKPKSIPVLTHKLTYPVTSKKEGGQEEITTEWGSIEGGRKFLERHFMDVVDNKPLGEYVYDAETNNADIVTVLGNTKGAKGNPRETDLKVGLMTILIELNKLSGPKTLNPAAAQLPGHPSGIDFDTSSMADLRELPEFDPKQVTVNDEQGQSHDFSSSTFHYKDNRSKRALVVPHSGYEFGGGHIPEQRQLQGKALGSRDCSSGISEIVNCRKPVSTLAQLYYYNLKTKGLALDPDQHMTDQKAAAEARENAKEWSMKKSADGRSTEVEAMSECFEVVSDPSKAQPGDIYFHRTYNLKVDPNTTGAGTGGHTALIAKEIGPDGEVWTIGYNRERAPNPDTRKLSFYEGMGLQRFSVAPVDRDKFQKEYPNDPYRTPMILRVKPR